MPRPPWAFFFFHFRETKSMLKLLPVRRAVLLSSLSLMIGAASADTGLSISNPQVSNDGTYVYYQFDYTGTPSFVRVFIDADQTSTTGYAKGGIGSEFLVENGVLYKYTATTSGSIWSWAKVGEVGYWTSGGKVRLKIDRSVIDAPVLAGQADDLVFEVQDASSVRTLTKQPHLYSYVTTPQLERFELVRSDGLQNTPQGDGTIKPWSPGNEWGGHMSRIVTTADGTVYMLSLRLTGAAGKDEGWELVKRDAVTGAWAFVASGLSFDEAHLLRSPLTDKVYVIAHPGGYPAMGVGPDFVMTPIPGDWDTGTAKQRHYGNAGIGQEGQICLKASHEGRSTADTYTQYICTTETQKGQSFGPFASARIGHRFAYDYVFPGVAGAQFLTLAQSDLENSVAGYPKNAAFTYVFNGINSFTFPDGHANVVQAPLTLPDPSTALTATVAPHLEQLEAYVDTRGRAFSIALKEPTDGKSVSANRTLELAVMDAATGTSIYSGSLAGLTYGSARIVEDAKQRLYVIWNGLGQRMTEFKVYRLKEIAAGNGDTGFSLELATDLSNKFAPFDLGWAYTRYATQGRIYLATPRGGTARSGSIDGYMNACAKEFANDIVSKTSRSAYPAAMCFGDDLKNQGQLKLIYFRIRLPD